MESSKFFVLTGPPGIGKTTLIRKICQLLKQINVGMSGFYTEEVRMDGNRVGFDIVTLNGKRGPLARISDPTTAAKGPYVGKYTINVTSLENLTLPLLAQGHAELIVIDEIGKMELMSGKFKSRVSDLMSKQTCPIVLATIPIQKGAPLPLVELIRTHPFTELFEVSRANREDLPQLVLQRILQMKNN